MRWRRLRAEHCTEPSDCHYCTVSLERCILFQVHSPLNLRHPHDVVIFMRQDARVNYLKKLEVSGQRPY